MIFSDELENYDLKMKKKSIQNRVNQGLRRNKMNNKNNRNDSI